MRQADIFLRGEGDRWLERNRAELGVADLGLVDDPVSETIRRLGIKPQHVLEIGCSNGWRLAALRREYGCDVMGIEPSHAAYLEAATKEVPVFGGATAAALPVLSRQYDLVIYGFCLYLVDPADWFKVVAEGDRALKSGGYLIVYDFAELGDGVWGRRYEHCDGVVSYHADFAKLWLGNPLYLEASRHIASNGHMVTVLRKMAIEEIEVLP